MVAIEQERSHIAHSLTTIKALTLM